MKKEHLLLVDDELNFMSPLWRNLIENSDNFYDPVDVQTLHCNSSIDVIDAYGYGQFCGSTITEVVDNDGNRVPLLDYLPEHLINSIIVHLKETEILFL